MEKSIRNADAVICKLELALIRAINHRLEVAKKKGKKKEMVKRQKIKAIATKR